MGPLTNDVRREEEGGGCLDSGIGRMLDFSRLDTVFKVTACKVKLLIK